MDNSKDRLDDLLKYAHHLGMLNQKPIFKIEDYKQFNIFEHQLKGRIGIQHNVTTSEGISIWLRVERLKRLPPPPPPEQIIEWVSISNNPSIPPEIKDKLIKTLSENDAKTLIDNGEVIVEDVSDSLKNKDTKIKSKDVIFRLENNEEITKIIDQYLNEQWVVWSEEEKPRRETIGIYDSLFSIQQTIESQGDEQPIELIWGTGVSRWICEGHKLDIPLIEKAIEIEVDTKDGSIHVYPRTNEPNIVVSPFFALENPGVDLLLRFSKKHFSELSDDIEFSPYLHESFEPVLRKASSHLSESGVYWPDINPNKENREPNKVSETLEITDSWVIFARPRSTTAFIQDIERFQEQLEDINDSDIPFPTARLVTELSDKKELVSDYGLSSGGEFQDSLKNDKQRLLFPKPFNDAQVEIIEKLQKNDGVVVQGPPGTGKTHTIANIICHYLATGRSVLVTSKGEPALSVLQEQIPVELRNLTISLLTNERQGMKQLEQAVQLLAGLVCQTNLKELKQDAASNETRVDQLEKEIREIDREFKEFGLKQLKPIDSSLSGVSGEITALELAQHVINEEDQHDWFTDILGSDDKFCPQFSDSDIANIRSARREVGIDIRYVGKYLPSIQDLIDTANIVSIHDDLSNSARIAEDSKKAHIPPLAVSVENSVERAKNLVKPLNSLLELLSNFSDSQWLRNIFELWINASSNESIVYFESLFTELTLLIEERQKFVRTLVEIKDPSTAIEDVNEALSNLINDKKAFGLFSFGHQEAKTIIDQARIDGEKPTQIEQWKLIKDYVEFQFNLRKFIVKWNHLGNELDLPELTYAYGSSNKDIKSINDLVNQSRKVAKKELTFIRSEVTALFPHGIDDTKLAYDKDEIDRLLFAIELNTSRITLGSQRLKLQDLTKKLTESDGDISENMKAFVTNVIGNTNNTSDMVMQEWQGFLVQLENIKKLSSHFNTITEVADKVFASGASEWANKLKTEPLLIPEDDLTPVDWNESWQWKRREQYLKEIDGREKLKELSERRSRLDIDLKRTFTELIKNKTNIGLHMNMTERVQGALMRFVSAVSHIGKGTGKRAPRHRKDAYRAMQDCYSGVPCWIMPTWRVSESLPSDYGSFDLVIIDEASQSDITALPAIMRAKKLLVVGDDKQVSPTAAFIAEEKVLQLKHNFLGNQPFSELLLPGVSIYDLASSIFPSQRIMLTEHFRCVEPIIRFSMQFYTEPLLPLRIPKASEKITPPLVDVFVKGGCRDERKKVNELEAEAIIDEIKQLVLNPKYKARSIGVVSLIGAQQAKYIQDKILVELGEDVYQEHHIACGDASTFQGKERDIIFLSMVIGPGQGATMTKREYEQRFNVALSRAKDRMYLYRSIEESDLRNESDLRLKVLQHFKFPMPQQNQVENPLELCDSEFERDVFTRLSEKGYNVTPQVQVGAFSIDMVVEGENDRRLAIELDGDKYHPPEKWMDDWSRQRTMERVGWIFWRCWGSTYTVDPDGCIDDLISVLTKMQIHPNKESELNNIYTEYREFEQNIKTELQVEMV